MALGTGDGGLATRAFAEQRYSIDGPDVMDGPATTDADTAPTGAKPWISMRLGFWDGSPLKPDDVPISAVAL